MTRLRHTAALLLLLASACGRAPIASDDIAFAPGMSLLEALDRARLVSLPASSMPPAVQASSSGPLKASYAADDWVLGPPPNIDAIRQRLPNASSLPRDVRRWRLPGAVRLDLPRGECTVASDGEALMRVGEEWDEIDAADSVYVNADASMIVWFTGADGRLMLLAEDPPDAFTVRYAGDGGAALAEWEWSGGPDEDREADSDFPRVLTSPDALPDAVDLARRVELDGATRSALVLPAPGVLGFDVDVRALESITFSVGLVDHGFTALDGTAVRKPAVSDGARVSVVVERQLERTEIWSDKVLPGEPWKDVTVALGGSFTDPSCTVWLVTEGGDDAAFDYVAWSGLRGVGRAPERSAQPSVVLIVLDTLRDDTLGQQRPPATPRIDAWSQGQATRYVTTRSVAPWTLPAMVSMLSGLDPLQHTVDKANETMFSAIPHVAELLRDAGYETRAYTGGGYLARPFGLDRGFDVFVERADHTDVPDWTEAMQWVGTRASERPFFLMLHSYYVHATYVHDARFEDPDDPYSGPLAGRDIDYTDVIFPFTEGRLDLADDDLAYVRRMYDAGAARIDEAVLDVLAQLGDDVAVFITSDHGEEFLEHGSLGHGHSLHAELVDVPLVVRWPEREGMPTREPHSSRRTSLVDIAPTLLDLAGAPRPDAMVGVSLFKPTLPSRPLLSALPDQRRFDDGDFVLIVRGGGRVDLFDADTDPEGLDDLAERQPERVDRMRRVLTEIDAELVPLEGDGADAALDATDVEALRAMGYLDGGG